MLDEYEGAAEARAAAEGRSEGEEEEEPFDAEEEAALLVRKEELFTYMHIMDSFSMVCCWHSFATRWILFLPPAVTVRSPVFTVFTKTFIITITC